MCNEKRSKEGSREIKGTALGAGISFPRVLQQGQPDAPGEELGASGKEKISVGVRHLGGKRVMQDWVRGLCRMAEEEGSSLKQSKEGEQLGGLGGWVPRGKWEGGVADPSRRGRGQETHPGRAGKGAVVGASEGRSHAREVGVTCSAVWRLRGVAAGDS